MEVTEVVVDAVEVEDFASESVCECEDGGDRAGAPDTAGRLVRRG